VRDVRPGTSMLSDCQHLLGSVASIRGGVLLGSSSSFIGLSCFLKPFRRNQSMTSCSLIIVFSQITPLSCKCPRNHGPARLIMLVLSATCNDGCNSAVGKIQILQREQPQRHSCDLQMSEGPCRSRVNATQGSTREGWHRQIDKSLFRIHTPR